MQDAMAFFLNGTSDDYVDIDQSGVINMIRGEANAKLRSLFDAARTVMDDSTFEHRVDKDFSDLTMIAAQCPGAGGRSDMLIMLTEKLEHTQQIWWAAEYEFTNGLKKEMKAKWEELFRMRVADEKFETGEFRKAAKVFGSVVATCDRSRSPPGRAPTRDEGPDWADLSDDDTDTQTTVPLRGPQGSAGTADADSTQ